MSLWRLAGAGDAGAIEQHLLAHIEAAMFPVANLRAHGARGGTAARATRFRIGPKGDAFGLTTEGMVMVAAPAAGPDGWWASARDLAGTSLKGALGAADQVRAFLAGAPTRLNEEERLMTLPLADLRTPDAADAELRPLDDSLRDLSMGWRAQYATEVLGTPAAEAGAEARTNVDEFPAAASHRVLFRDDRPVSMAGFNTALPEAVQVDGVFTLPDLRRRGCARLAVAPHPAQARAEGVARAILFSSRTAAARAYAALGFRRIGSFALVLFDGPAVMRT